MKVKEEMRKKLLDNGYTIIEESSKGVSFEKDGMVYFVGVI